MNEDKKDKIATAGIFAGILIIGWIICLQNFW
jgi:hypothetical protein